MRKLSSTPFTFAQNFVHSIFDSKNELGTKFNVREFISHIIVKTDPLLKTFSISFLIHRLKHGV